jgi:prophage regulatory protein
VTMKSNLAVVTAAAEDESEKTSRRERLLRLPRVKVRVPYSRSTIYAGVKDGTFPKPVKLGGRAVAWRESDIDAWIESRKEA